MYEALGLHGIPILTIYIVLYVNNSTITPFIVMGYNTLPACRWTTATLLTLTVLNSWNLATLDASFEFQLTSFYTVYVKDFSAAWMLLIKKGLEQLCRLNKFKIEIWFEFRSTSRDFLEGDHESFIKNSRVINIKSQLQSSRIKNIMTLKCFLSLNWEENDSKESWKNLNSSTIEKNQMYNKIMQICP